MGNKIKYIYFGADSVISSLGAGTVENIARIERHESGLKMLNDFGIVAGKIDTDNETGRTIDGYTIVESLLIRAIEDVLATSGVNLDRPDSLLIISTTKGNIDILGDSAETGEELLFPDKELECGLFLSDTRIATGLFLSGTAERIARYFNAAATPLVVSNACISGVSALITGARLMQQGLYDNVIVAGVDILSGFVISGFQSLKSLSANPCRPFDRERDGLSLGEACAAVLLTTDRDKAREPAVILKGGAVTNDANHISGPSRTGDGLHYAISAAMNEAGTKPHDIGFINAHGTATVFNDEMESKAVNLSGLTGCPLNSLKGYFGHTLGASGVIETIVCAEGLRRATVYGTKGFDAPGVPYNLNISAGHRHIEMKHCLKTASGFGGCNAAIVMGLCQSLCQSNGQTTAGKKQEISEKIQETAGNIREASGKKQEAVITASVNISPVEGKPFAGHIRELFKSLDAPNMKFYKMDNLSKLGYVAAEKLLKEIDLKSKYHPTGIAVVLSNRSASLDSDIRHQQIIDEHAREGCSPAVFVYTLPNIVLGEICIKHKIQGENAFFVENINSGFVEEYATLLVKTGRAKAVIYGWCELLGESYGAELKLIEINRGTRTLN